VRDLYPAYKPSSERELTELWKTCVFAFDASALLDCYRLTPASCDEYFWALEKVKDRIWLPHQAGLEYYDNRVEVIETGEASYGRIPQIARDAANVFKKALDRYRQYRWIEADRWESILERAVEQIVSEISAENHVLSGYPSVDPIEQRLQTLFAGKVGDPYLSMYKIFTRAEQRIQLSIPPGFKDSAEKKDFHRYGDIVLWFQLLDFAKASKKGLVFITSDSKADWWNRANGKTAGVRPELVQEMHMAAGVRFHMYTPNRFMEYAKQFFGSQEGAPVLERTADELLEVQNQKAAEAERERIPVATLDLYEQFVKGLTSPPPTYSYEQFIKGLTSPPPMNFYEQFLQDIPSRSLASPYAEIFRWLASPNPYEQLVKGLASRLGPYEHILKALNSLSKPREPLPTSPPDPSQAGLTADAEGKRSDNVRHNLPVADIKTRPLDSDGEGDQRGPVQAEGQSENQGQAEKLTAQNDDPEPPGPTGESKSSDDHNSK
jgi:hypothetical protein